MLDFKEIKNRWFENNLIEIYKKTPYILLGNNWRKHFNNLFEYVVFMMWTLEMEFLDEKDNMWFKYGDKYLKEFLELKEINGILYNKYIEFSFNDYYSSLMKPIKDKDTDGIWWGGNIIKVYFNENNNDEVFIEVSIQVKSWNKLNMSDEEKNQILKRFTKRFKVLRKF